MTTEHCSPDAEGADRIAHQARTLKIRRAGGVPAACPSPWKSAWRGASARNDAASPVGNGRRGVDVKAGPPPAASWSSPRRLRESQHDGARVLRLRSWLRGPIASKPCACFRFRVRRPWSFSRKRVHSTLCTPLPSLFVRGCFAARLRRWRGARRGGGGPWAALPPIGVPEACRSAREAASRTASAPALTVLRD